MSTIDADWETMSYTNRLRWWVNNVWNTAPAAAPTVESAAEPAVAPEPTVESAVTTEPIVGPVGAESVVEPTESATLALVSDAPAESVIEQPVVHDSATHVSEPAVPAETVSAVSATPVSATPAPAPATESKKHKKHWNKRTVNIQH
jgi:hypothetical protein